MLFQIPTQRTNAKRNTSIPLATPCLMCHNGKAAYWRISNGKPCMRTPWLPGSQALTPTLQSSFKAHTYFIESYGVPWRVNGILPSTLLLFPNTLRAKGFRATDRSSCVVCKWHDGNHGIMNWVHRKQAMSCLIWIIKHGRNGTGLSLCLLVAIPFWLKWQRTWDGGFLALKPACCAEAEGLNK